MISQIEILFVFIGFNLMKKISVCPSKHALMSPPPHNLPFDEEHCLQYLLSPRTLSHLATVSDDVDHELRTPMQNAKHLQSMADATENERRDLEQLLHDDQTSLQSIQQTINMMDGGYSPISLQLDVDDKMQLGLEQFRWQRRRSLMSSFEDAETINAPNPVQRQMEQLLTVCNSYNGKGWQPPKFDVDLSAPSDGHSFLSPKLFHSKKMLDSNLKKHQQKQGSHEKQKKMKKKGPKEIGRMTGFKSPKFSESVLKENEDGTLFLDTYRSWYPSNSNQPPSNPPRAAAKHRGHHSRWNSSTACAKPSSSSVARKNGKPSLRLSHSDHDHSHHVVLLTDADISDMAGMQQADDDDDDENGVVFLHDYNRDSDRECHRHSNNSDSNASNTNKEMLSMRTTTRTRTPSSKVRKCKQPRKSSAASLSSSSVTQKRRTVKSARGGSGNKTYWNSNNVDFLQEKCNTLTTRRSKDTTSHKHGTAAAARRDRSRPRKHTSDLSGCVSVCSARGVSEPGGGGDLYLPHFDGRKRNQKRARTLDIHNADTDLRDLRFSDYLQHLQFDVSALKHSAATTAEEDDTDAGDGADVARACKRRKSIELFDSPSQPSPMTALTLDKASEGRLPSLEETQHAPCRSRNTGPRSKSNTVRDFKSSAPKNSGKKRNSKKLKQAHAQSPLSARRVEKQHYSDAFAMEQCKFAQINTKPPSHVQANLSSPSPQQQQQRCSSNGRRKSSSAQSSVSPVDVDPISIDMCINNEPMMNSDLESGGNSCNSVVSYSTNSSHIESKIPFDSVSPISPAITPPYLDVPCGGAKNHAAVVGYKDQPFLSPTPISHSICSSHAANDTEYGCNSPSHHGSDVAGFVFTGTAAPSSLCKKTPTLSPQAKPRKSSGFYIIVSPRHHQCTPSPVQSPNDHSPGNKSINGTDAKHRKTRKMHRGAVQIKVIKRNKSQPSLKTKTKTKTRTANHLDGMWD